MNHRVANLLLAIFTFLLPSALFAQATIEASDELARAITFTESNDNIWNPDRGLYDSTYSMGKVWGYNPFQNARDNGYALVMGILFLNDYKNTNVLPQSLLDQLDNNFQMAKSAGVKIIFRIYYRDDVADDAVSLATIQGHLDQLTPILQSHQDSISVVQAGLIGLWGEWHNFKGEFAESDPNYIANRKAITDKLLTIFSYPTVQIQLRTPVHKESLYGTGVSDDSAKITTDIAFSDVPIARIGHHNDCFLRNETDAGTYPSDNIDFWKNYVANDSRHAPMGGETCGMTTGEESVSDCGNALQALEQLQFSYLNNVYHPDVLNKWKTQGCYETVQKKLGYRLVAVGLDAATSNDGRQLNVALDISNQGYAAPYQAITANWVLHNDQQTYRFPLAQGDIRRWQAGTTVNLSDTITLVGVETGDYCLSLQMGQSWSAIRLANTVNSQGNEVWNDTDKQNLLMCQLSLVSPDNDNDGTPDHLDDDDDNDGMSDDWETANGLNALDSSDATADLDADGIDNLGEYLAGTNPADNAEYPGHDQPETLLGIYYGGEGWSISKVNSLESWHGRKNAALMLFTNWDPSNQANLFNYQLPNIWNDGHVPLITWMPSSSTHSDYTVRHIGEQVVAGDHDAYLTAWATELKAFLAGSDGVYGNADDRRAYISMGHEMNGTWYHWSGNPSAYVAMWQHVRGIFDAVGFDAEHLQWMWVVNNADIGGITAEQYYPGDAYVDWVGMNGYNWTNVSSSASYRTPSAVFGSMLARLRALTDKPVSINEVATWTDGSQASIKDKGLWVRELFSYAREQGIRLLSWFNKDKSGYDWQIFAGTIGAETLSDGTTLVYPDYKAAVQYPGLVTGDSNYPQIISEAAFTGRQDSDKDGLSDVLDSDDDNDGLPDVWENSFGLNARDASDALLDGDNDTLSNKDEYLHGSNPLVADTGRLPNYVLYWDNIHNSWSDQSPDINWQLHSQASESEQTLIAQDLQSIAVVAYSGQYALAMPPQRWRFLHLQHTNMKLDAWQRLEFQVHGGSAGGQVLQVRTVGSTLTGKQEIKRVNVNDYIVGGTVAANEWRRVSIPLADLLDDTGTVSYLSIGMLSGTPSEVYYLDDIYLAADPNPAPALQINIDAAQVKGELPHALFGVNGGFWMTDLHADPVVAQVNALGSPVIRYPGGSSSDTFHWLTHKNDTDSSKSWQTTTDEYFQLLNKTGTAGMITANFGSGTAQEAADWASYASSQGAHIPYWEVGNEIYGDWETSWTHDGTAYMQGDSVNDGANAFCAAIKLADPNAKVSMVGTITPDEEDQFGVKALAAADACFDYYSIHYYTIGPGTVDYAGLLSAANADLPAIGSNVRAMLAASPNANDLKVALTEYNSYWTEPELPAVQTVNMLFMADVIGQAAEQGFSVANAWSLGVTPDDPPGTRYGLLQNYLNLERQPSFYVYPLWRHSGDQLLNPDVNRYASQELSVYASKHSDSGDVTLIVINKSPKAQTGSIALSNIDMAGIAEVYTVQGASLDASQVTYNGHANPPVDLQQVQAIVLNETNNGFEHHFAPYSVSSVTIKAASDNDNDGAAKESSVPNLSGAGLGDANGDNVADAEQAFVTSLKAHNATNWLTYANTANAAQGNFVLSAAPVDVPADQQLLYDAVQFDMTTAVGADVTVEVYVDQNTAIVDYLLLDNNGNWTAQNATVTHAGNKTKLVFTLTEGGIFDRDGTANGVLQLAKGGVMIKTGLDITPYAYLFGNVEIGALTPAKTFTLSNPGSRLLSITTVGLAGHAVGEFSITNDACSHQSLAPNASCEVAVGFQPISSGSKSALLQFNTDDPDNAVLSVFLHNHESSQEESSRRLPPVLNSLEIRDSGGALVETMRPNTQYTIEWSILGYHSDYLSAVAMFDCSAVTDNSCGANFTDATRFLSSGGVSPAATVDGSWSHAGERSKVQTFTYTFTTPNYSSATPIVIRFYRLNQKDLAAGNGGLSLIIPGNHASQYYDTTGRRVMNQIAP